MQDKIKSKWDNFDLLLIDDQNQIYKCFELVGIYKEYIDDMDIKEDFEKWYLSCIEEKRYHYRNLGVIETYDYYGAAEPPVRRGVSHLSGLMKPLH